MRRTSTARRRLRCGALAALVLMACAPLRAQVLDPAAYFDAFAGQPGAQVIEAGEGGRPTSVEVNGVRMTRIGSGSATRIIEVDRTGRGAVLCNWMVMSLLRSALDACHPDDEAEAKADLDEALRDTLAFMLANDAARRPASHWQAEVERQRMQLRDLRQATNADLLRDVCRAGPAGAMVRAHLSYDRQERRRAVAEMLSVPRHPVLKPCL